MPRKPRKPRRSSSQRLQQGSAMRRSSGFWVVLGWNCARCCTQVCRQHISNPNCFNKSCVHALMCELHGKTCAAHLSLCHGQTAALPRLASTAAIMASRMSDLINTICITGTPLCSRRQGRGNGGSLNGVSAS